MKIYSSTYQPISLINAPTVPTEVIWDLTILFGAIAIVYFASIFFFRNRISKKSRKTSDLKVQLSPIIGKFIFYEENASKEEKNQYIDLKIKIRDMLQDDFTRKVVSEILLDLRKDVSGSAQDRLFELFQGLNLQKESYKKLKSWRWERISQGIQELTNMNVGDSYQTIAKFINDRRGTIRKQAEIGVVALHTNGINHFLDTTRHKISEWQQLKLMEVLSNKTDFKPPSFKAWLTATNKFVVLFALRLIKYYNQNDAKASIIELVKHNDNQIKQEAIDCIKTFYIIDALPVLKKVFWSSTTVIKISILDAIGGLGTSNDLPFLRSIGNKERNYSVTDKALSAINEIAPENILPTKGIIDITNTKIPEDIVLEEYEKEPITDLQEKEIVEQPPKEEPSIQNSAYQQQDLIQELEMEDEHHTTEDLKLKEITFSTDFIPLVVETEAAQEQIDKQETMQTPLYNLEVVFEEVLKKYHPKEITKESTNINDIEVIASDLDFLPIVVANQENHKTISSAIKTMAVDYEVVSPIPNAFEARKEAVRELLVHYEEVTEVSKEAKTELNDIQVFFEEIKPPEIKISSDLKDDLDKPFDFEVVFDNGSPPLRIPKVVPSELFNIEVEVEEINTSYTSLAEIEVIGKTVTGREPLEEEGLKDLPLWLLNEIANENGEDDVDDSLKMMGPEWEAKESQMMSKIQSYFEHLPKPEYYDNEITETIQLINDLALFGDEREIPLLQELMEKENQIANKERIDSLMKRFMGNDAYGSAPAGSSTYNVFEELFRNCDTESKLVLLDEIVLIGDEKEIQFLEQLIADPNPKIKEKAKRSLELMKERLERVESGEEQKDADEYERFLNMMELMPPKESGIFDIDFEISLEDDKELEIEKEDKDKSRGLTSFFTDLLNRLTN